MEDAPPVQVEQPCCRINGHRQPARPCQLGGGSRLLASSGKAVVQAAPAAVLCRAAGRQDGQVRREQHHTTSSALQGHSPVMRAGGTATRPMNWTMLQGYNLP